MNYKRKPAYPQTTKKWPQYAAALAGIVRIQALATTLCNFCNIYN